MELVAHGDNDAQIARVLGIKPQTVTHYVTSVRLKLGAPNRTSAAVQYILRYEQPIIELHRSLTIEALTPQEHRVIALAGQGANVTEIAAQLEVSPSANDR